MSDCPVQVSIVKITHPKCADVFPRERLFGRLDSARRQPVTWIAAPAGSGKTTLVASYLMHRQIPSIWYRVDEGDSDIATFFYYMGLAAQRAAPRIQKALPLFTPEYLQGVSAFTLRYFEKLCSGVDPPFVIVFDNYQHVPSRSEFHEVISCGLGSLPEHVQVVVVSRENPPPAFARLQAGRKIHFLRNEAIRFTLEETRTLVRFKTPGKLNAAMLQRLHDRTQGWAAGIVLMMENAAAGMEAGVNSMPGQTPQEIFDYFAIEIYAKMDRRRRSFLLNTVFLPGMTLRTAEQLTGEVGTSAILSGLHRKHFFVEKSGAEDPVYHYHPLFQEFLLNTAYNELEPKTIRQIRHTAAGLLLQSGRIEDAAEMFLAADDWKAMTGFILQHAAALVAQGRSVTVETWIGKMPPETRCESPWLLYWSGVCRLAPDPFESRVHFEAAFQKFSETEDSTGMLLAWSGVVESILFAWDDYKSVDPWIDWLDACMADGRTFPDSEVEARVTTSMAGALCLRCPQRSDARHWIERALALSKQTGDINLQFAALHHGAFYHMQIGDFDALDILIQRTKEIASSPGASDAIVLRSKAFEPMKTEISPVNYRETVTEAIECLAMARETGANMLDFWLYAHGVYGAFNMHDLTKADQLLRGMQAISRSGPRIALDQYHFLLAWYHFLRADVTKAVEIAEKSLEMVLETGLCNPEIVCRQLVARVLQADGKWQAAAKQLQIVKELSAALGKKGYFYYVCLLIEAQFNLESGNNREGLHFLGQALRIGRQRGYMTLMFCWQRPVMTALFRKALEAGIESDYVRNFVRAYHLFPDQPPLASEHWPWPLKIYTLGRFDMLHHEASLTASGRLPKKPLQLLQTLIAFGGKDVQEERISDRLWPEADGDRAHSAFTTTLSRLRRFIGSDQALNFRDGRLSLNPRCCWVDVWAFEEMMRRCRALMQKMSRPEHGADRDCGNIFALMEKALDLYGGPFLSSQDDEPWVRPLRNRLREQFSEFILRLAVCLEAAGRTEEAAALYQKILKKIQPADAELARHLINRRPLPLRIAMNR